MGDASDQTVSEGCKSHGYKTSDGLGWRGQLNSAG